MSRGERRLDRPGLQPERTSLAWERTGIAMMVAGVLMARAAAVESILVLAGLGLTQVIGGGVLLVWAGQHYADIIDREAHFLTPVHPRATRLIGLTTVVFTGGCVALAVVHGYRGVVD